MGTHLEGTEGVQRQPNHLGLPRCVQGLETLGELGRPRIGAPGVAGVGGARAPDAVAAKGLAVGSADEDERDHIQQLLLQVGA